MPDNIRLLPENIANQIAAGEVVQRPASVVKELLENATDAGANSIGLHIKEAGKTYIQVVDNGSGMSETDARMCFERHATSKIQKIEDLFTIGTFGFRGEAMASIAAVARVEMKSKTAEEDLGRQIIIEDSRVLTQEPCVTPTGTNTVVKNLFFNVPARKNFLKSDKVEKRHIVDEFIRVALPNYHIKMVLTVDGREEYHLRAGSLKQRIVQLFGKRVQEGLIPIEEESDIVSISGFIGKPELARKMRGEQFFLANQRFIRSPYFNHAIMGAFEGILQDDHYPLYVLFLRVNPNRLDVNVHPTKTEVKFEEEKAIYAIIKTAVRKALAQHQTGGALQFDQEPLVENAWDSGLSRSSWKPSPTSQASQTGAERNVPPPAPSGSGGHSGATHQLSQVHNWKSLYQILEKQTPEEAASSRQPTAPAELLPQEQNASQRQMAFQLGQKYIVTRNKSGLVLVHQRKAHQRILYEKFLQTEQQRTTQQVLFHETLPLSGQDHSLFQEIQSALENLGFTFEQEQNEVRISGIPPSVSADSPVALLQHLLAIYQQSVFIDSLSLNDKVARSLARAASVKEGQTLQPDEMIALIDQLFACEMPYYHFDGTPTVITLGLDELDKKFGQA